MGMAQVQASGAMMERSARKSEDTNCTELIGLNVVRESMISCTAEPSKLALIRHNRKCLM